MTRNMCGGSEGEVFELQAGFCKSLSDSKRLRIIHILQEGEQSVNDLAEMLNLKQSNTSQHLAILRNAGVIAPQREGNTVYYSLVNAKIATACDMVREIIAEKLQRNQNLAGVI